jgi:hypothetical protein
MMGFGGRRSDQISLKIWNGAVCSVGVFHMGPNFKMTLNNLRHYICTLNCQ